MNVIPSQEPSSGPNYFFFDDNVEYAIHLDLNRDGVAEDLNYRGAVQDRVAKRARPGVGLASPVANVGARTAGAGITALERGRIGRVWVFASSIL